MLPTVRPEKDRITFDTEGALHEEMGVIFQQISDDASASELLRPYGNAVREMYDFFSDCYRKNLRLLEVVQGMNATVILNASKISIIVKSTDQDRDGLVKLKTEYDEVAKMVELAHRSEGRSKQLLANLRDVLLRLTEQLRRGEAFSFGEEGSVFEVAQDVANLRGELDRDTAEMAKLHEQLRMRKAEVVQLSSAIKALTGEAEKLEHGIADHERVIEQIELDANASKAELIEIKPKIAALKGTIDKSQKKKAVLTRDHHAKSHVQYETLTMLASLREESKSIREKQTRKVKHHDEMQRANAARVARIEAAAQQLSQLEADLVAERQESERIEKQLADTEQASDMALREAEGLSQQKTELRKVIHDLRPRLVNTQFRLTRSDNDSLIKEREVKATENTLDKRKLTNLEAEQAHSEVLHAIKTTKNETRHMKPFLEQQKDKVVVLYREIDDARSQVYRINSHVAMTEESITLLNGQTAQHLSELKELQQKTVVQTTLSDKLRDERNAYKRQFEMQEKENAEMLIVDTQLEGQIVELQAKYETMLQTTALNHYTCRSIYDEIAHLKDMTSRCQQDILVTERIISRMQTETQTLDHILRDAAHDHLQQQKERQLLDNNKQILAQELHNKNVTIEKLRSQIKVDQAFLQKCSQVYNEQTLGIGQAANDLARLEGVTRQLEEKREKIRTLEYDIHRTFAAAIMEKHKCATLVYELSIPRNIHRWQIMAAVDATYVMNMRYRCSLSARLDVAHRELIALITERDRLRKQLAQAKKLNEEKTCVSRDWVEGAIRTYEHDIKRMDEEISAMNEHRVSTQQLIDNQQHRLSGARTSLTERVTKSQSLMAAIDQRRSESVAGEPVYYITEAPIVPFARGFSKKVTPISRRSAPTQGPRTRMSGPLSVLQLTKGIKPHGQHYVGRNVILPSME